eukprot:CAMPEP_0181325212 /NCGR_PEP_ID=MMETSP1101-20121128/20798_1 /TAXON_ID=46948 /ORGANISM="Rhodomonas abbreviata, Strain Caron Lab Isolate" /LENGTH=56 /DNA_ID=CAMNT_0023433491 /DNA_START=35 /DNA_END=205 /DNA_ORIENTATION=-
MPSQKSLRVKLKLAKESRKNRNIPAFVRYQARKNGKAPIRYNMKRRNWRRTKIGYH